MIKKALVLLIVLGVVKVSIAQNTILKGVVYNEEKNPVEFANVLVYIQSDTLRTIAGTITDLKGNFIIKSIEPGSYLIKLSCLGYTDFSKRIELNKETGKFEFVLKSNSLQLQEVEVSSNKVSHKPDKSVYLITDKERQQISSSLELVKVVPNIKINPLSKTISSTTDGSVKILVNGISADEQEILSINPKNILKIEHFDFPPAQYINYDAVVNIITKPLESGIAIGCDLANAFTTGFANDMGYLKYTKNKQRLSLRYSGYYRDYTDREFINSYRYVKDSAFISRNEIAASKFGYFVSNLNVSYNIVDSLYSFQIKATPNSMTTHDKSDGSSLVSVYSNDENLSYASKRNGLEITPGLDIYFLRLLKNNQELNFNANLNYFNTDGYTGAY